MESTPAESLWNDFCNNKTTMTMTSECIIADPHTTFQKKLEHSSGVKLKLKINDNRSTMLSVRSATDHTKVSLHRMFLEAPRNVMDSLACYIRGEHESADSAIHSFIESNLKTLDYSHTLDPKSLETRGQVYDLQQIYNRINKEYFQGSVKLLITWFGKHAQKNRSRITFGLYHEPLKLIKIHRILDDYLIPLYVVEYVIYHEMVHHVCPAYVDSNGTHKIHNEAFRERELEFRHYQAAREWIASNQERLFAELD